MVFGVQKLQNQVFCLTEERDFFQGKYLEQVSEIANLKEELLLARREIARLRKKVLSMDGSHHSTLMTPTRKQDNKNDNSFVRDDEKCSTTSSTCSSLSHDDDDDEDDDDDNKSNDKGTDIRQSAEKLLQWASYRSSAYTSNKIADHHLMDSTELESEVIDSPIPHRIKELTLENKDDNTNTGLVDDTVSTER